MPLLDFELKGVLIKNGLRGKRSRQGGWLKGYCTNAGDMILAWTWVEVVEMERSIKF